MNVNVKYLKDESGNIISPIVSSDSVLYKWTSSNSYETLTNKLTWKLLGQTRRWY